MMSALLTAVAMILCSCGVQTQSRPEQITIANPHTTGHEAPRAENGPWITIYFVRGVRLEPARRSVRVRDVATALQVLATGPTRQEVVSGVRTAVGPQEFTVIPATAQGTTVVIQVPREFTGVAGGNQLLAVAQLVWTATEFPAVERVRLTSEAGPLEVPTDEGLSDQAVSRDDYRSVAPRDGGPVPSEPSPTPATDVPPPATGPAPSTPSTGGRLRRDRARRPSDGAAGPHTRRDTGTWEEGADHGRAAGGLLVAHP